MILNADDLSEVMKMLLMTSFSILEKKLAKNECFTTKKLKKFNILKKSQKIFQKSVFLHV